MKMKYIVSSALAAMLSMNAGAEPTAKKAEGTPKNPIVAKVKGKEIRLSDLFAMRNGDPYLSQLPIEAIYDRLRDTLVMNAIVTNAVTQANLAKDAEVQKLAAKCQQEAERAVFLKRKIDTKVTTERLKKTYQRVMDELKKRGKEVEVGMHHMFVKTEAEAKKIIEDLDRGRPFDQVAQEKTGRAPEAGFVTKNELSQASKELAAAVFVLKPGSYTKKAIKTADGFHVVKVDEKRERRLPAFEEVAQELRSMEEQVALYEIIEDLQGGAGVEVYTLQGKPDKFDLKKQQKKPAAAK